MGQKVLFCTSGAGRRHSSTERVRFVDGRCRGGAFVHRRAVFCGRGRGFAPACPYRGCVLWKSGAAEGLLSTGGRYFVDADGELRPPVHGKGAFCGRTVPRRGFCPQAGGILWMRTVNCGRLSTERVPFVDGRCRGEAFVHRREVFCGCGRGIAAACPHRGCVLWTDGAEEGLLSTERVPNVDGR